MENGATAVPQIVTDTQRIQKATEYKNEGNQLHKEGNIRHAIGKYHRALLQLKGIGQSKSDILGVLGGQNSEGNNLTDEVRNEISKIQLDCYNNLAASILKKDTPNYEKIIDYCDKVLELDSVNEKALYRKGTALNTLGRYDEAVRTLESSFNDLTSLRKPLTTARDGQRLQSEKLKKNLQGMFDNKK